MVRTRSAAPHPVLEKMRYTDTERIADWTKRFFGKTPEPAKPPHQPKRKIPPKRTVKKRFSPMAQPGTETTPEKDSPVFIRKTSTIFPVRRQDNPEVFERMAFVIKACSNDPRHKALMVLHVEQIRGGSWLIASDGKRLHAAFTSAKIRSGDYQPVLTKDAAGLGEPVTGIVFPDWRRVIPGGAVQRGLIDLTDSGWGKDTGQTEKLYKCLALARLASLFAGEQAEKQKQSRSTLRHSHWELERGNPLRVYDGETLTLIADHSGMKGGKQYD